MPEKSIRMNEDRKDAPTESFNNGDICRVCRSPSSQTQALFHPCKCSGSMKYIHQSCLEQWLKHSGKRSCDICNHVYAFTPIYSPDSPETIGIINATYIIVNRMVKKIGLYSRIAIASLCWLMWVPYVTAWTWRLFLNPTSVLEEQAVVSLAAREPKFTRFIASVLGVSETTLYFLELVEMSTEWPVVIKSFLSDVFEGQIICTVVLMIILVLLLIREYILANDQAPIVDLEPVIVAPLVDPPVQLPMQAPAPVANLVEEQTHDHVLDLQNEQFMEQSSSTASGTYSLRSKSKATEFDEESVVASSSIKYPEPPSNSFKGKGKLVLDDELEAELNASLPLLDLSLQPSPIIPSQEEIARQLEELRDVERNLADMVAANDIHVPQVQNEDIENEAAPVELEDLNMVVNVGIEDGEIIAQVEVNDVNAFLDLVGVRGSFTKLLQSISLAHLIIMLILGVGIWVPYLIGNFSTYIIFKIIVPSVKVTLRRLIISIQTLSDPLIEPIVDKILSMVNVSSISSPITANISESAVPAVVTSSGIFSLFSDLEEGGVPFGPYHSNFFQSFKEDLFTVFLGYSVLVAGILLYSSRVAGRVQNPYLQAITRFAQSINAQLSSAIKIILFVVLELACFPFYCGLLIDLCTLPVLSSHSTIATRYALFNSYPWLFCFLHWIIGSTFMFQLAMYVASIREMLRPGVLWFLKDPNDPNFNAMRELLRRSLTGLVRKLLTGVILYGTIIVSVVGGGIKLIEMADSVSTFLFGPATIFKVLPLRLEYYDTLSEIPFDLFFFHFILPQAIRFMKPYVKFRRLVAAGFIWAGKVLRISHFLLGKPRHEEESDFEDEEEIHNPQTDIAVQERSSTGGEDEDANSLPNLFEEVPEEVPAAMKSEVPSPNQSPNSSRMREKRYMRVPNMDNIEIIPKEKMMIPMREEDPLFGRPGETEEEVKTYWTKVYVPDRFYTRLWVLVFIHMAAFLLFIPVVFALPVVCGRMFFVFMEWYLVETIIVPSEFNFVNPVLSHRKDLPTHDFYSFFAGICALYIISQIGNLLYRFVNLSLRRLRRRNAIRRSRTGVRVPLPPPAPERFRLFWHRKGLPYTLLFFKFIYFAGVVGYTMPVLLGIVFDIYVITPIQGTLGKAPIVFFILDWSTGAMAMRIVYNILAMAPERRITRLINQANTVGLARANLGALTAEIFAPIVFTCLALIAAPLVSNIIDFHFGLPSNFFNHLVIQNGALAFIAIYIGFNVFSNAFAQFRDWFDHLKDDQYLVGRTLQNIE